MATLANAWVSVSPTGFGQFAVAAKAGITAALKNVNASVKVNASTLPALAATDALKLRIADLQRKAADIHLGIKDKEAIAALIRLQLKLGQLDRKVARPKITLEGKERALADILAVDVALDRLNRKSGLGRLARIRGAIGGLPGISRIASIGSAVLPLAGGTAQAGGQAGAGGLALLYSNPYSASIGTAAAIGAAPFAAQALGGGLIFGLGGGLAALGIAGALGSTGPQGQLRLTAARDRLAAARLRLAAAQAGGNPEKILSAQATVASAQATFNTLNNNFQAATATQAKIHAAFANLSNDAQSSLAQIGTSFQPVMLSIFNTADSVLGKLTPVFAGAVKVISGPFKVFSDTLINAFAQPAVQQSIKAVAGAFGSLLTALTPQLGPDVKQVADGISKIAAAVAAHPQAFAQFIRGFFDLAGWVLTGIAALIRFGNWIDVHLPPALHHIAVIFDGVRHETARIWALTWQDSIGVLIRFGHDVEKIFDDFRHRTAVIFDGARHEFATIWDDIGNQTVGRVVRFLGVVVGWFQGLPARILTGLGVALTTLKGWGEDVVNGLWNGAKDFWTNTLKPFFTSLPGNILTGLGKALTVLSGWGAGVITGLLDGARSVWQTVVNFFSGLVPGILHALGIKSPPQWAIDAGVHIMEGIGIGLKQAQNAVTNVLGTLTGISGSGTGVTGLGNTVGGSVGAAQAYAKSILGAFGWGQNQWPSLLALWQQESGWRWNATNPSSGAYGIPQSLPADKMASAGSDWRTNAATQIRWGLGYIRGRYGSPFAAEQHELGFGWYGSGLNADFRWPTVIGVGERGPEHVSVTPVRGRGGMTAGELAIIARLDALLHAARAAPVAYGHALSGTTLRGANRGYYG